MNFKVAALIGCALLNFTFGLFVYLKNKESLINLSYAIFMFFVALWSFGLAMFYFIPAEPQSVFWSNFLYFMGNSIAVAFFYSSLVFPSGKALPGKKIALPVGFLLLLFFLYFFTPTMVQGITYPNGIKTFVYGKLHLLFDIHFSLLFALAFWKLYQDTRHLAGQKREQAKYLLLSTFIGVVFNGFTNVTMPSIFHNCSLIWIGPYITVVMVSITAYAIVKYNLLSIDVAAKELVARIISFSILTAAAYLIVTAFLKSLNIPVMPIIIASSLIVMTLFYSLHKNFSNRISQAIRPRPNFEETFRHYTEFEVIGSHNVKELTNLIVKTIRNTLKPKVCSLMLMDRESRLYNVISSSGKDEEIKSIAFKETNYLISTLRDSQQIRLIVRDELNKILSEDQANLVRHDLKILNAQISLPLKLKGELVGLLSLGPKVSGELYTPEEINFISVFSTQSAMMIRFLEEIGEFEKKLIYAEKLAGMTNLLDGFNHEFRNQIHTVQFYIANLDKPELKKEMKNYRKIALTAFDSILMILESVYNYRLASEQEEISSTSIKENIDTALLELQDKFASINVKISTNITKDLPNIETYPSFIYLFPNILRNCYYALIQRKTRLLDIQAYQTKDSQRPIEIVIKDTGGDMPKVIKDNISSGGEYFPERATVGGINFFLAKHIIDDHMGELVVSTSQDLSPTGEKGTIFTIRLPLKQPKSSKEA